MAESKTKATGGNVDDYIASRADEQQRADCKTLMAMLRKVTGESPTLWGPSIVGYGSYSYRYESGRTGESCVTGFAIRGRDLVVYLVAEGKDQALLLSKLGKHKMGKSCLYFKRLSDLARPIHEVDGAGCLRPEGGHAGGLRRTEALREAGCRLIASPTSGEAPARTWLRPAGGHFSKFEFAELGDSA